MDISVLETTEWGKMVAAALVSMIPVIELRGGIPFGVGLGLTPFKAWAVCVIGNMLPIPIILIYVRRVFLWLRRRFPRLGHFVDRLERKVQGRVQPGEGRRADAHRIRQGRGERAGERPLRWLRRAAAHVQQA